MRFLILIQCLFLLWGASVVSASQKRIVLELQPVISINRGNVLLPDLVKIYGDKKARLELSKLSVAIPASLSTRKMFRRGELEALISPILDTMKNIDYEVVGPSKVRVSVGELGRSKTLRTSAAGYLYRTFKERYPSLKVKGFDESSSTEDVPDGWAARLVRNEKPYAHHCVWLEGPETRTRECFQLEAMTMVPVSRRVLENGDLVTMSDITPMKLDVSKLRHAVIEQRDMKNGLIADLRIHKGEPIYKKHVREKTPVSKNSLVTLVSKVGAVAIMAKAKALENGLLGESVSVKMIDSDVVIRGLVEKEDTVLVARGGEE